MWRSWTFRGTCAKSGMVKSEEEIALQARAGEMMAGIPKVARRALRPGVTELELSAAVEDYLRRSGHGACMRVRREGMEMTVYGVCSSGVNSLAGTKFDGVCGGAGISAGSPYGASMDKIVQGSPVILDYCFNLHGYMVDQTRMCSLGTPSADVTEAYDTMVEIERALFDAMRPGRTWESVYELAAKLAGEAGYDDVFMGLGSEQVSFVGHGIGLDLDEPPLLAPKMIDVLEAGMVIAVEPKVALPNVGVVGIEDTVVVRENGVEYLTKADDEFLVV